MNYHPQSEIAGVVWDLRVRRYIYKEMCTPPTTAIILKKTEFKCRVLSVLDKWTVATLYSVGRNGTKANHLIG